jgi:hypothetical protein
MNKNNVYIDYHTLYEHFYIKYSTNDLNSAKNENILHT